MKLSREHKLVLAAMWVGFTLAYHILQAAADLDELATKIKSVEPEAPKGVKFAPRFGGKREDTHEHTRTA